MSGVITQLGAVGKQDADTFINPNKTLWKEKNNKYTQFAMEPKTIEFQGSYGYGRTTYALLPRNGDLLPKIYVAVTLGNLNAGGGAARFTDDIGRWLFEEIRFEAGSVKFDVQYSEFEHMKEEVGTLEDQQARELTRKSESEAELVEWAKNQQKIYVPLTFHFFNNWADAYPIIALHLTDTKIYVKFRSTSDIIKSATSSPYSITSNDATIVDLNLLAETVYLDDPERDWFAETQHKYVIAQNQSGGTTTVNTGAKSALIDLTLNHPTRYLCVLYRKQSNLAANEPFNFSGEETGQYANEPFVSLSMKLNGNDRIEPQDPIYFRVIQPKQHFKRIPRKHGAWYSFGTDAMARDQTGTLNFSRIDNAKMTMTFSAPLSEPADILVFCQNLNVVTVGSGVILLKYAS